MNFGLALASQRIPGIVLNLVALNNNHEPESAEAALITYSKLIMPERNLDETIKRLAPLLNDPDLEQKIDQAAGKTTATQPTNIEMNEDPMMNGNAAGKNIKDKVVKKGLGKNTSLASMQSTAGNNSMLSQVVGIVIGSPEFQRK
jgi:hypothetical protein